VKLPLSGHIKNKGQGGGWHSETHQKIGATGSDLPVRTHKLKSQFMACWECSTVPKACTYRRVFGKKSAEETEEEKNK
jgi:hypothetical protein